MKGKEYLLKRGWQLKENGEFFDPISGAHAPEKAAVLSQLNSDADALDDVIVREKAAALATELAVAAQEHAAALERQVAEIEEAFGVDLDVTSVADFRKAWQPSDLERLREIASDPEETRPGEEVIFPEDAPEPPTEKDAPVSEKRKKKKHSES